MVSRSVASDDETWLLLCDVSDECAMGLLQEASFVEVVGCVAKLWLVSLDSH